MVPDRPFGSVVTPLAGADRLSVRSLGRAGPDWPRRSWRPARRGTSEATDSEVAAAFAGLADEELDLLSDENLQGFADALEPNSSSLAVVWENTWAARLATALRESGGEVVAQGCR